jgi:hypothetical protein
LQYHEKILANGRDADEVNSTMKQAFTFIAEGRPAAELPAGRAHRWQPLKERNTQVAVASISRVWQIPLRIKTRASALTNLLIRGKVVP